jgi:hypothetical protein
MGADVTARPYLETFGCGLERLTEDGWEHDHDPRLDCQWGYRCSQCGTEDLPCAEHAPTEFPGLRLAECAADPPHARAWLYATDAYPPPCMYCAYHAISGAHRGCEHSHHRAWRRWRITHKLARWGYSLGVVKGHGASYGGGCENCLAHFRWGRSGYLLGWDRWRWQALPHCLRAGHWPSGSDACSRACDGRELSFCVRCAPCPGCDTCRPAEAAVPEC